MPGCLKISKSKDIRLQKCFPELDTFPSLDIEPVRDTLTQSEWAPLLLEIGAEMQGF